MAAHDVPVQAQAAQGVRGGIHGHLQTPRVIARGIQGARVKAGRQLTRGLDFELPVGGQQEILLTHNLHIGVGD